MSKGEYLRFKIALSKINTVGPKLARQIVSYCGGVEAISKQKKSALVKIPTIGHKKADEILNPSVFQEADLEMEHLEKHGIKTCFYLDEDYPIRLNHHEDAPTLFYYKGEMSSLHKERTVAIVGTRSPTEYGKSTCDKLIQNLQSYNCSIISGLAYGIDSQAHRKSVELEIPTYGILGCGFNKIYPQANKKLSEHMLEHGGLLTEFGYHTQPDRENFPMRNRIIAGLSDVVVVIESKSKGGSIITAEIANAYNKDVFAVPGKLSDEFSEGCNRLIKQHKANLIESARDIAYIMRWEELDSHKVIQPKLFVDLTEDEKKLVDLIKENPEINIDQISARLPLSLSAIASCILNLEFKGVIRSIPGKRYTLN